MKWLVTFALMLAVSGTATASQSDPVELARQVTDELLTAIKSERASLSEDEEALHKVVDELLLPHVDTVYVSRVVLGRHWRSASDEQRREFIAAFRNSLIRTYASALLAYEDQEIRFPEMQDDPAEGDVRVRMEFVPREAPVVPVTFRMHQRGGEQWRVYDVVVEDVSLVTNFRGAFDSEIRRNGLEALIAKLQSSEGSRELVEQVQPDGDE